MARQEGIIQLSGKLGNLVFSQKKDRNSVKAKSTKPVNQTENSKKSSSDFGSASSAAARIRKALKPLLTHCADDTLINRLNKQLISVFKTIPKEFAGNKKLKDGDINLLRGFQFNSIKSLDMLLLKYPTIQVLPANQFSVAFAENIALSQVTRATAAVIELICYNMDLDSDNDQLISVKPLTIPLIRKFGGAKLKIPAVLAGDRLVLVAIGVHYLDGMANIGSKRTKAGSIVFAAKYKDGIEVPFLPLPMPEIKIEAQSVGLDWELE